MGKLSLSVNIFAIVYTAYAIIWFPFPQMLPVTGDNMKYALTISSASTLFALLLWVFYARKHWAGLNKDVVPLVAKGS